ncbi:MAG: peptidoglycan endopeptidase, partial [Clostridiales bacterium]|nr:peptidoglycan endopeptidase [Clostridiales bacterium]
MNKTQLEALIQSKLEKYKKVPFIHNGRDMQGLDCLGFLILFYREFGVKIPGDDGREIDKDWYKKEPDRYIKAVDK